MQDKVHVPLLSAQRLCRQFADRKVLNLVDLELRLGERVCLLGSSGSGKSTLLHILGGLDAPDSGAVYFQGEKLQFKNDEALSLYRRNHIGLVFQFHYLITGLSAKENIEIPLKLKGGFNSQSRSWLDELVHLMGMEDRMNLQAHQLSGGEQQRVGLMRALVHRPAVLLCDEPTGNLDSFNAQKVMDLLFKITGYWDCTLLVVTHDQQLAQNFQRRLHIRDGQLSKAGIY